MSEPGLSRTARGRHGEERAAALLERRGFRIVARNVRSRRSEVDLVARRGEELVFVEVKSWHRFDVADLEYAIDRRKQRRLTMAARAYLARHRELAGLQSRFDVILLGADDTQVHHIENAFAVTGGAI